MQTTNFGALELAATYGSFSVFKDKAGRDRGSVQLTMARDTPDSDVVLAVQGLMHAGLASAMALVGTGRVSEVSFQVRPPMSANRAAPADAKAATAK